MTQKDTKKSTQKTPKKTTVKLTQKTAQNPTDNLDLVHLKNAPDWIRRWAAKNPKRFAFSIEGTKPVPKMRARHGAGKRPRTPDKLRRYELQIALEAAKAGAMSTEPLIDGEVVMVAMLESIDKRIGDLSNLIKSVEDAMNGKEIRFTRATTIRGVEFERGDKKILGRVWSDDRKVAGLVARRKFGDVNRITVGVASADDTAALHDFMAMLGP